MENKVLLEKMMTKITEQELHAIIRGVINQLMENKSNNTGNVETFYRGVRGSGYKLANFGLGKKYRCMWLAETPEYAAEYATENEDGHLYAIDIDMSKVKEYDWYESANSNFDPYEGFSEQDEKDLLEDGYNAYSFALDEGTVLVLFEPSPIVSIRELKLADFLD